MDVDDGGTLEQMLLSYGIQVFTYGPALLNHSVAQNTNRHIRLTRNKPSQMVMPALRLGVSVSVNECLSSVGMAMVAFTTHRIELRG